MGLRPDEIASQNQSDILIVNGAIPFKVTAHSTATLISNLFPNLVPCDSKFYFYPTLNQRENICCQPGCHHVNCCVGRAEHPQAQIRLTE